MEKRLTCDQEQFSGMFSDREISESLVIDVVSGRLNDRLLLLYLQFSHVITVERLNVSLVFQNRYFQAEDVQDISFDVV